jgi:hypothetical protein
MSKTVAPITETITRLTTWIFSMFQILENHFSRDREPLSSKAFEVDCPLRESGLIFIGSSAATGVDRLSAGNGLAFDGRQ